MNSDEQEIRQVVSAWMAATKAGDVNTVMSLMSDDVVFLVAGQPPMHKADFERAARTQSTANAPRIDGVSDIQEIRILGDWAFLWSQLRIVVTPQAGKSITRAGHTLTLFTKRNGKWLLARDANMLTLVSD
jgi:uncharacterized protein (TIGR02246 family)